jgi:hypothetical protein
MGIVTSRASQEEISDVLNKLEAGELSAENAIKLIRKEEPEE